VLKALQKSDRNKITTLSPLLFPCHSRTYLEGKRSLLILDQVVSQPKAQIDPVIDICNIISQIRSVHSRIKTIIEQSIILAKNSKGVCCLDPVTLRVKPVGSHESLVISIFVCRKNLQRIGRSISISSGHSKTCRTRDLPGRIRSRRY